MHQDPFTGTAPVPAADAPHTLAIRFRASGSEYFRIWLVNQLLTIVTLSLYLPFARARRLRYFYSNTFVGEHALSFHGDAWKMFRGYLLVALLGLAYTVASRLSPLAALVALGLFGAMWPALWRSSLRFRLGNTRWRGVALHFSGGLAGAWLALAPLLLPMGLVLGSGLFAPLQPGVPPPLWLGLVALLGVLGLLGLWPLCVAWTRRWQHSHYHFGPERTAFHARAGAFYKLQATMGLLGLGMMFGLGLLLAVLVAAWPGPVRGAGGTVAVALGMFGLYLAMAWLLLPFWVSRLQNLVWNATASEHVQFRSALGWWPLAWLGLQNAVLTIATLGLYRPFAAVNTARLRLEAVSLVLAQDPERWLAAAAGPADGAAADALGDFFGIDLGL